MMGKEAIIAEINESLSRWNPLDVPAIIAEVEYLSYVESLISVGPDADGIKKYLEYLLRDVIGLDYSELNPEHAYGVDCMVAEILGILKRNLL